MAHTSLLPTIKTGFSSLFLTLQNSFDATGFALVSNKIKPSEGTAPELTKLGDPLRGLSFVLKDIEGYYLEFYKDTEPIFRAKLLKDSSLEQGSLALESTVEKAGE